MFDNEHLAFCVSSLALEDVITTLRNIRENRYAPV